MKFKVGDKVEAIMRDPKGKIGTIVSVWSNNRGVEVAFNDWKYGWGKNSCHYNMLNNEIKLIKQNLFTKSDLKDGDIVTSRNGNQRTLKGNRFIDKYGAITNGLEHYNNELRQQEYSSLDIIKVERPTNYETVFERKEEILDKVEKEYLRSVIKPFRNKIKSIGKYKYLVYERDIRQHIVIIFTDITEQMSLRPFCKDTMYKKMELNKAYTLEELGL